MRISPLFDHRRARAADFSCRRATTSASAFQHIFGLVFIAFLSAAFATSAYAENSAAEPAQKFLTPAAERGIERGVSWLVARQHDDGSFGVGLFRGNAAVSALSGMALLAAGSTPGRGPYGDALNRCLDFLLKCVQPSGFVSGGDAAHGPMYGHGFAVMFLAECHGISSRPDLREKLAKAVHVIVNCQNKEGGWRYQPVRGDADISVTVCQVMALRAARNAGLFVPAQTIDNALSYIKRSQNSDGGFMYMLQGGESGFPRSAAAVMALYSAGVYQGPEIDKGLNYLLRFLSADNAPRRETYYYYGQYYAAQAMWQAGGKYWEQWFPVVRDELLARQNEDGSWHSPEGGNECATAMACIVLQIPNNCLPILQR